MKFFVRWPIFFSAEEGIYLAVTDAPTPVRFNITDLSTLGRNEALLANQTLQALVSMNEGNCVEAVL